MREYPILHLDTNVNEPERVSNITLRHKCKWTWEREYPILHLDTNINEHERVSNITLKHKCKWTWESIQYYT